MIRANKDAFDREIGQMTDTIQYAITNDDDSMDALNRYERGLITPARFALIIGGFIAAMCAYAGTTH